MKEKSRQVSGRGPDKELQDALKQDRILRLLMNEDKNKDGGVVAIQVPPTATKTRWE